MTTLYSYRFENENGSVAVYFVDNEYNIIKAEQLAQLGHQVRRNWATRMIKFIHNAGIEVWTALDLNLLGECSFGQRLRHENWVQPAVVLLQSNDLFSLYIYRYFRFI